MTSSTPTLARRAVLGVLCGLFLAAASTAAQAAALLTLTRDGETLELSLDDLQALPQRTVVTAHEFTNKPVEYRGPLARDVLDLLGLDDLEEVRFTAANDYFIDVPTSDLQRYDVILALEADGRRLSRRDKGPIWLMYPISDNPELSNPIYNARLIWQVIRADAL